MCYALIRPLLFRLDPERAHDLSLKGLEALSRLGPLNPLRGSIPSRPRTVMGLEFPNPVGLAAGLDKDGVCLRGLAALGFGFLEVGTVTPRAQPGNPKPRLFRLESKEALINRMGFNNDGIEALLARVTKSGYSGLLGINLGKNKDTPLEGALSDYRIGLEKAYPLASYVTINVSSPNTPGLRDLQGGAFLDGLIGGLMATREQLERRHGRRVPLVLKIAPDLSDGEIETIAATLLHWSVDGVIATNTTSDRSAVADHPLAAEAGGLSGRPVFDPSTRILSRLANRLQGRIPIIGCGGIFSLKEAQRKMDAGAALVQVYSGLIYRGPGLIRALVRGLD